MPLTCAFALKVGMASSLISAAAYGYCGLVFAKAIEPLLTHFNKNKHSLAKEEMERLITTAFAALGFIVGNGASLMALSLFKITEMTFPNLFKEVTPRLPFTT